MQGSAVSCQVQGSHHHGRTREKLTANVKPQAEEPKTIGKSNRDLMGMDKTNIYGFTDMEMRSMELDLDVLQK